MNDTKIQQGQEWLEKLLTLIALPSSVATEVVPESEGGEGVWLKINHESLSETQIQRLIGEKGAHIDALQYLTNITLNHGLERDEQHPFTVDIGNYRQQRLDELKAIATEVAAKVEETGEEAAIENLSSAERRQMHSFFKEFGTLKTESRGQEPHRNLVVSPL
ncbi:MAG: R3H domain-containing nucleic acid-binding protein [Limnothrix sp.]